MFDGEWEVVSGRLGGEPIPLPQTRLTIQGSRYVVESPGSRDEGMLEWGEPGETCTVDLQGTAGDHAGRTIRALARVKGDLLQLSYAVDGGRRPRGFMEVKGAAVVTVRYRRVVDQAGI